MRIRRRLTMSLKSTVQGSVTTSIDKERRDPGRPRALASERLGSSDGNHQREGRKRVRHGSESAAELDRVIYAWAIAGSGPLSATRRPR
jgi:hypothetical protein